MVFRQIIKNLEKDQVRLPFGDKNIYHHEMNAAMLVLIAIFALRHEGLLRYSCMVSYPE